MKYRYTIYVYNAILTNKLIDGFFCNHKKGKTCWTLQRGSIEAIFYTHARKQTYVFIQFDQKSTVTVRVMTMYTLYKHVTIDSIFWYVFRPQH